VVILEEFTEEKSIEQKIDKARQAFKLWSDMGLALRNRYLKSLKNIIYCQRKEIADILVEESARVRFSAEGLVFEVLNNFFITKQAKEILCRRKKIKLNPLLYRKKKCWLVREPIGVVGIISPANSPFFESFQQIIQAVVMGNTVVVKPSEATLRVSKKIEELVRLSDMPDGVINIIHGGPVQGEVLTQSKDIGKILFYGNRENGRKIAADCAQTIKPSVLGLGGHEAAIVLEDCYLSKTVDGLVYGAFCNAGQTCSCIRRVIALAGIKDILLKKLKRRIEKLNLLSLDNEQNEIGVIKKEKDARTLIEAIKEAESQGAKVVTGGQYDDSTGRLSPVLITNVNAKMRIMQEEFMGPYLCFASVDFCQEAVDLANGTLYGLSGSIWSSNFKKAKTIAREIKTGIIWINDSQFFHHCLPYGGIKQSGYGKVSGKEGLLEYTNEKLVVTEGSSNNSFPWFPYTSKKMKLMRKMLNFKHEPGFMNKMKNFIKLFQG
jgi:acyl-CoA reductase-like NAD-dependent aldehyde dehydrogenase